MVCAAAVLRFSQHLSLLVLFVGGQVRRAYRLLDAEGRWRVFKTVRETTKALIGLMNVEGSLSGLETASQSYNRTRGPQRIEDAKVHCCIFHISTHLLRISTPSWPHVTVRRIVSRPILPGWRGSRDSSASSVTN